jgi:hypothetical protein
MKLLPSSLTNWQNKVECLALANFISLVLYLQVKLERALVPDKPGFALLEGRLLAFSVSIRPGACTI